jgi:hypothetical protein
MDLGLMSSFLSILGVIIGAFIGSYLASFWTERRELMRKHHEEIKEKLLAPLKHNVSTTVSWVGDRATGLDISEMIDRGYSPSFLSSIDNGIDKKLKEASLKEHFPEVSTKLEQLRKDLEDYDSKYIELATRVRDYLLKSGTTTTGKVGDLTKFITYTLLEVPQRWLDSVEHKLSAGELRTLERRLREERIHENMLDQNRSLISDLNKLSDGIKKEGDALINDLEDLLKRPTLKLTCRYCPPSLRRLLFDP